MDGRKVLMMVVMAAAAGTAGFAAGKLHESAKTKKKKTWKEIKDSMMGTLKAAKEKWPDAWEATMEEKGDELDEDFRKELEEL